MKNLAQSIPAKYRKAVYTALAALSGVAAALKVQLIADYIPDQIEHAANGVIGVVVTLAAALGFTVAVSNVPGKYDY